MRQRSGHGLGRGEASTHPPDCGTFADERAPGSRIAMDQKPPTTATRPCEVFVVEDDSRIRQRFIRLIESAPQFAVSGSAETLSAAIDQIDAARRSGIVLVDLRLPDGNGAEFIRLASQWSPRPFIAVISALGDERSVVASIEAGADGYLLKDTRPDALLAALEALGRGESPVSPRVARHLLSRIRPAEEAVRRLPSSPFSRRELEVLRLVARGYSHEQVAEALSLTYHTVITHVRHVYAKLGVNSRAQALYEAAQLGLVRIGR